MPVPIHLSRLHCEPNMSILPYYAPARARLWRVRVDDQLIGDTMIPFTATSRLLEVNGNIENFIFGDGDGYISVRRMRNYVVWFPSLWDDPIYYHDSGLPDNRPIVFDADYYTNMLDSLGFPNHELRDCYGYGKIGPAEPLSVLTAEELYEYVAPLLPSFDLPLYRIPDHPDDPRGAKLLRRITEAFEARDPTLTAVAPPTPIIDVQIGLDRRKNAECLWSIGQTAGICCIQFEANPAFPLWLTSDTLDWALKPELREAEKPR